MKEKEGYAILAVSRQGVEKALEVKEQISEKNPEIYTMEKYATEETNLIRGKIGDFFGELMAEYDTILCIMATGIVVRSIAAHLDHKSKDPGILVMDQEGQFVISLLSGHLGHANENAIYLAKRMGATPVITTGTDVKGSLAVDVLSEKLGCSIEDFTAAKEVTALILDDATVGILNNENCDTTGLVLPKNLRFIGQNETDFKDYAGLVVSSIKNRLDLNLGVPTVQIIPRKIVVGIGCRKETEASRLLEAVTESLRGLNLHPLSVKCLATIGLKANEPGLHEVCQKLGASLKVVPDNFVKMVQGRFKGSEFVYKTTGLYAVSEPCGYVASGFGHCLLEKQKWNGITVSVWAAKTEEAENEC